MQKVVYTWHGITHQGLDPFEQSTLIYESAYVSAIVHLGIVDTHPSMQHHHVVSIPAHNLMGDARGHVCGWRTSTDMPPVGWSLPVYLEVWAGAKGQTQHL